MLYPVEASEAAATVPAVAGAAVGKACDDDEDFLEEARHRPPPEGNVDWGPHSSSDSHLLIPREGR